MYISEVQLYIRNVCTAQFIRDRITNCHSTCVWFLNSPYHSIASNFQHHFSLNLCCSLTDVLFILEGHLTNKLLPAFPTGSARLNMWLQHSGALPHFSLQVTQHLNQHYGNHWINHGGLHAWPLHSPVLAPLAFYLLK